MVEAWRWGSLTTTGSTCTVGLNGRVSTAFGGGPSRSTLWVLDSKGNVVSAPDLSADPPGLYPSQNIPERRELWTGYRWTGVFPER